MATEKQRIKARQMLRSGMPVTRVAARLRIPNQTVALIKHWIDKKAAEAVEVSTNEAVAEPEPSLVGPMDRIEHSIRPATVDIGTAEIFDMMREHRATICAEIERLDAMVKRRDTMALRLKSIDAAITAYREAVGLSADISNGVNSPSERVIIAVRTEPS